MYTLLGLFQSNKTYDFGNKVARFNLSRTEKLELAIYSNLKFATLSNDASMKLMSFDRLKPIL